MKIGKWILSIAATMAFAACDNNAAEEKGVVVQIPSELQEVDNLLKTFSSATQNFTISGKKQSVIKGSRGTIVHIDPSKLETVDGSPISEKIDVSMIELSTAVNMMLNGVITTTGNELLEAGGAFYVKMWSKGIELQPKANEKLNIEFPKWAGSDMSLYIGEEHSLGQVSWREAGINFASKNLVEPEKPVNPEDSKKIEDIGKQEYNIYLLAMQEYNRELEKNALKNETFEAVSVPKLGWFAAANVIQNENAKGSVKINVKRYEGVERARFFMVSKETNSVVSANYWSEESDELTFDKLPIGANMVLIGVAVVGEQVFVFQQNIETSEDLELPVEFKSVTAEEVRRAVSSAS